MQSRGLLKDGVEVNYPQHPRPPPPPLPPLPPQWSPPPQRSPPPWCLYWSGIASVPFVGGETSSAARLIGTRVTAAASAEFPVSEDPMDADSAVMAKRIAHRIKAISRMLMNRWFNFSIDTSVDQSGIRSPLLYSRNWRWQTLISLIQSFWYRNAWVVF